MHAHAVSAQVHSQALILLAIETMITQHKTQAKQVFFLLLDIAF